MDEDNSSIPETHKLGISASCPTAPVSHGEPPFSARSETGSQDEPNEVGGQISQATYNVLNPIQEPRVRSRLSQSKNRGNDCVGLSVGVGSRRGNGRHRSHIGANKRMSLPFGYDNWAAIAGFFDGDGGLDIDARSYTLHWVLNFVDNWPPQLLQIKQFMESQGMKVGALRPAGTGGYRIEVAAIESLQRCALAMLEGRNLFKKRKELEFMLDYFNGKISGDDVISMLNEEVRSGIRLGKLRVLKVPYTYFEGKRVYKKGCVWNSQSLLALNPSEKEAVRKRYVRDGLTIYQLALKYHVSPSTIFRTVRGLRRGN
jgi:hypothetical protein